MQGTKYFLNQLILINKHTFKQSDLPFPYEVIADHIISLSKPCSFPSSFSRSHLINYPSSTKAAIIEYSVKREQVIFMEMSINNFEIDRPLIPWK